MDFKSHSSFKLPRVPAGRFVAVHMVPAGEDPLLYEGIFETMGCENLGAAHEVYVLRRIVASGQQSVSLKVPRHWQEIGGLTVYQSLARDEQYSPTQN